MSRPAGWVGAAIIASTAMIAVPGSVPAQESRVPENPVMGHFIRAGSHVINLRNVDYFNFNKEMIGGRSRARAWVYFAGNRDPLQLHGVDAERLMSAFGGPAGGPTAREEEDAGSSQVRVFDDFDGKLTLNWKPVRPDPSHVSLTKNPGKLTITTQRGSIHGEETKDEFGAGIAAKNLFLIDNPLAKDAEFVVTTCVSGFIPEMPYQQAGLIVYDDDDNYLKWSYEYNWPNAGGQVFCCVTETDARPNHDYAQAESGLKRYWLRLTKRGDRYEYAASTDGDHFRVHGSVAWGDGAPKRIGLLAKNGGNKDATEQDAAFEFFELGSSVSPQSSEK
jgi:regulation of enolase protein 1 (concanavalin A-like superfamily)